MSLKKITHLCLACFYPDNYSYQENMLPKYHKKIGYNVEVIASLVTFGKDGKATYLPKAATYYNEYGIKVTRLDYKKPNKVYKILKRYIGLYEKLEESNPDILFIHGCQFLDIDKVLKYVKIHNEIEVYIDNHADFSNSGTNFISLNILHKFLWRKKVNKIDPYIKKYYGVLPARVDWLKNIYCLPKEKCELLVMGADDEKIEELYENNESNILKNKYLIDSKELLIVTGGKIDIEKKQVLTLMKAVSKQKYNNVKLLIFGPVASQMKAEFESLLNEKIIYIGWISSEETYKIFNLASLVVFPGRHSVLWEQVVAMGIPLVCKYWEGTTHIDIGGNVKFIYSDSETEICQILDSIILNKDNLKQMQKVASSEKRKKFLYSDIAKKSLED